MILFGWAIEFNHGQIGFSKRAKDLIDAAAQRGEKAVPFALYKSEDSEPATDVAQPGETKDGSRTT